MKNVRWGIIGCGDVTEVKSGPALQQVEHSALVAVMRRNAGLAEDYARRHGVARWYNTAEELIADPSVNAVYVATPPDTHAAYAMMAMDAGKPVYIEKPMARSFAECQSILASSAQNDVKAFVAYYRRALPGFLKVRELIASGAIGKVRLIRVDLFKHFPEVDPQALPWRVVPRIAGGGHFFDLASHQLDFLDFLFGPVKGVRAHALNQMGRYQAEDVITASFRFAGDIVCSGTWCFSASQLADRDIMEFVGEKGTISMSCFEFTPVRLANSNGERLFEFPKPAHVQLYLIRQVVDALLERGRCDSTAESAARTNWVMDQVVREYYGRNG